MPGNEKRLMLIYQEITKFVLIFPKLKYRKSHSFKSIHFFLLNTDFKEISSHKILGDKIVKSKIRKNIVRLRK